MRETTPIGRHSAEMDGDLLILRMRGTVTLSETKRCLEHVEQCMAVHGRAFVLIDHSEVGEAGLEVRRELAAWARTNRLAGIAICGGSLGMRAVSGLLVRGIALLYSRPDLIERVTFVRTEAEARTFLAQRRAAADREAARAVDRGAAL